jgi:hypothetical protein
MESNEVLDSIVSGESDYNAASGEFEDITGEASEQSVVAYDSSTTLDQSSAQERLKSKEGVNNRSICTC